MTHKRRRSLLLALLSLTACREHVAQHSDASAGILGAQVAEIPLTGESAPASVQPPQTVVFCQPSIFTEGSVPSPYVSASIGRRADGSYLLTVFGKPGVAQRTELVYDGPVIAHQPGCSAADVPGACRRDFVRADGSLGLSLGSSAIPALPDGGRLGKLWTDPNPAYAETAYPSERATSSNLSCEIRDGG